ncbi:MAG: hypothetical protein M1834_006060 [Cirrosporium novae-zelandiae]|nr:MAG: hypothetical protein M1834_006060 [Cirrosporium novae-zelandiae]
MSQTKLITFSKQELRYNTRYLRDVILPQVIQGGFNYLSGHSINRLSEFLQKLEVSKVTVHMLSYSRIHNALEEICNSHRHWSLEIVKNAQHILSEWEENLGPLSLIQSNLWEPGGRMEGCCKTSTEKYDGANAEKEEGQLARHRSSSRWIVKSADPTNAYVFGHNGFQVGQWWIKQAAAFRDGIIDNSTNDITHDSINAYAIVLKGTLNEIDDKGGGTIYYHSSNKTKGVFRVMHNLVNRRSVRILRTSKLGSKFAPACGVRYDGLYRISGHSVKLRCHENQDEDNMEYVFELKREPGQPSMKEAMRHPMSDELDDWKEYQAINAKGKGWVCSLAK